MKNHFVRLICLIVFLVPGVVVGCCGTDDEVASRPSKTIQVDVGVLSDESLSTSPKSPTLQLDSAKLEPGSANFHKMRTEQLIILLQAQQSQADRDDLLAVAYERRNRLIRLQMITNADAEIQIIRQELKERLSAAIDHQKNLEK